MDLLLVLFILLVSQANLVFNQLVTEAAAYSPHPELLSYSKLGFSIVQNLCNQIEHCGVAV